MMTYLALEFARLEGGDEVLDVEEVVPAERALHVVDHALRAGAQDVAELVLRRRRRRHRRPGKNLSINCADLLISFVPRSYVHVHQPILIRSEFKFDLICTSPR